MIGQNGLHILRESSSTKWLTDLVWKTAARLGYGDRFPLPRETEIEDDHHAISPSGDVPAVDLIDFEDYTQEGYWHTPQDTLDKISRAKLLGIAGHVILESVKALQGNFARRSGGGLVSNRRGIAARAFLSLRIFCYISLLHHADHSSSQFRQAATAYIARAGRSPGPRRSSRSLKDSTGTFILSSPRVWRYCGKSIASKIPGSAARRRYYLTTANRRSGSPPSKRIARELARAGADRRAVVVAVGGGVVGDVAGFAAATYLRGVRLVHIPTTVVAQVDSAVGGKTGVDLPEGKNLVGAFYPPKVVVADPGMLLTLPHREYRSGLYEVIKYGVIADPKLFEFLARRMPAVLRRDPEALDWIIPRSIAIKARVVSADEREGGLRQILNFGHTLGHALETATNYQAAFFTARPSDGA